MDNYLRYARSAMAMSGGKVKKITVKLKIKDCTGILKVTDLMLQAGKVLTGWTCNTQEMLLRHRIDGINVDPPEHYNALLRGQNLIIIPNTGEATTGIDFKITALNPTTGAINLATHYKTRAFNYPGLLQVGGTLEMKAATHDVLVGGMKATHEDYSGVPMTSPSGDVIYMINFNNRDGGVCLFTVTEWDKSKVTW